MVAMCKGGSMKKNLIFIVVDSLRRDFFLSEMKLGFKKFYDNGIFLNNLITHSPETYLSCGTYLTGLYPQHHKSGIQNWAKEDKMKTVFHYLKDRGYDTLIHGKYCPFGVSYGTGYYEKNFGKLLDQVGNKTMVKDPDIKPTLEWLSNTKQKPFFIFNHFYTLRDVESVMGERIDKCCERGDINKVMDGYREAIRRVDVQLDIYFDYLFRHNMFRNTLVILTADHGESYKLYDNHILGETGVAWLLHNGSRYDPSIMVPMTFTGLGLEHKVIEEQIGQVDIFPTMMKLIGVDIENDSIDGKAIDITQPVEAKDTLVYSTSETKKQAIRTKDGWKMIFDSRHMELFDLNEDPKEQNNIVQHRPDKVKEIFGLLKNFPNNEILTSKELLFRFTDYKNIDYVHQLFKEMGLKDEWDKRADSYDNLKWVKNKGYLSELMNYLQLEKTDKVLEVGCGTAVILDFIKGDVAKVYGIDSSPTMLQKVSKDIDTRVATADNLPFEDNFFDKVIIRMVLHHIETENLDKVIGECKRVLKPGGILLAAEGVPIQDDLIHSFKTLIEDKEERIFFMSKDLELLISIHFDTIEIKYIIMKQQSIKNWLNNSGTDYVKYKKIWSHHSNKSNAEYKKAANFTKTDDDDILCDFKHCIVLGIK